VNSESGGKSEKFTESNGSVMLLIGCGVAGPPKKIAAPVIATNTPKLIRTVRFTRSNKKKLSGG
jgi:hypothetical protein